MAWTDFLNSSMFQKGAGAAGSYLGAQQQAQQSAAQVQNDRDRERARLMSQALSGQQDRQLTRDTTGLAASDPSKVQEWRQKQAVKAALLPGIRNFQATPPAHLQPYAGQVSGGIRIPEGGFGQDVLSFYSPEARMAAEEQYWKAASPFIAPPNLNASGYGSAADATNDRLNANYLNVQNAQQGKDNAQLQAILQSLQGNPADEEGGWQSILGAILSALGSGLGNGKQGSQAGPGGSGGANGFPAEGASDNNWTWTPGQNGSLGSWQPGASQFYNQAPYVAGSGGSVDTSDGWENWDPAAGTWVYPQSNQTTVTNTTGVNTSLGSWGGLFR